LAVFFGIPMLKFFAGIEVIALASGAIGGEIERGLLAVILPKPLALVSLEARSRSRLREYSKGIQQRIGLAQAILHDPDMVILDEPTSALDPIGRREVRDVIHRLKERRKTVFLNSHLLSEIERTCDEVAILKSGEVVAQGPLEDLLTFSSRVDLEVRG